MGIFLFLTQILTAVTAFSQTTQNIDELTEIATMTSFAANIQDDNAMVNSILSMPRVGIGGGTRCNSSDFNLRRVTPTQTVSRTNTTVSFYYRMTAPVDDIRTTNLTPQNYQNELRPVITASDEATRNSAIAALCAGKSNMQKIEFASYLFKNLSGVYNTGMMGGNDDPYSGSDPTKDPSELQNITFQRQYNALNRKLYDSNLNVPPVGGVCRHASALVTDFLEKCGMNASLISGVSYRTQNGGHATVRAIDPETHRTYFLNWGELTEMNNSSGLTNFEIPGEDLRDRGMIIGLYHPGDDDRLIGTTRTNRGVVAARLLHVAEDEFDVTTYQTNELGAVIDLGVKKKVKLDSGNFKLVEQKIILSLIDASNTNFLGDNQGMRGGSVTYRRDAMRYFGDHFYWSNRLQTSAGLFNATETGFQQNGLGLVYRQGTSVGVNLGQKTRTTFDVGLDFVGEYYRLNNNILGSNTVSNSNYDTNNYAVGVVRLKTQNSRNQFQAVASTRAALTSTDDLQSNENSSRPSISLYNPQLTLLYARNITPNS